jgi:hypothetical protein
MLRLEVMTEKAQAVAERHEVRPSLTLWMARS